MLIIMKGSLIVCESECVVCVQINVQILFICIRRVLCTSRPRPTTVRIAGLPGWEPKGLASPVWHLRCLCGQSARSDHSVRTLSSSETPMRGCKHDQSGGWYRIYNYRYWYWLGKPNVPYLNSFFRFAGREVNVWYHSSWQIGEFQAGFGGSRKFRHVFLSSNKLATIATLTWKQTNICNFVEAVERFVRVIYI